MAKKLLCRAVELGCFNIIVIVVFNSLFTEGSIIIKKTELQEENKNLNIFSNQYIKDTNYSCPSSAEILPCNCSIDINDGKPNMDCSDIQDEGTLAEIFNTAYFPTMDMGEFRIEYNGYLTSLNYNFFGSVTFDTFYLYSTIINKIDASVFDNFDNTLIEIHVMRCYKLTTIYFPFEKLEDLQIIDYLYFDYNSDVTEFPTLDSSSLQYIYLGSNSLTAVPKDEFDQTPNIYHIDLRSNKISTIYSNTYMNLNNLDIIYLNFNNLAELPSLAFNVTPNMRYIHLEDNLIKHIKSDTFQGLDNDYIYLSNNYLTSIDESVFRPILQNNTQVTIDHNPIICDCNIAWVVNDPDLLELISTNNPRCFDGIYLSDLDLSYC